MSEADTLVSLVRKIEIALALVTERTRKDNKKMGVTLQKAELELKISTKKSVVVGGKIDIGVSIDASVQKDWSKAHIVTLSLTPKTKIDLSEEMESETLADTIFEIASAMGRISKSTAGNFNASEATASIDIEESKDGSLQVVAGGGGTWANSHTLKLTFRPT